jgi:hypothetical protein
MKQVNMKKEQSKKPEMKTHYTHGGIVTKDTLSLKEQKELREKQENGTLNDDERKKLMYDDSLSSIRSTTGILREDTLSYNPNVEYFMLDYHLKDECRWVRMGYMTQIELLDHLRGMVENYTNYSGFRIHSEKELDMKMKVECVDGEYRELTLRHILFDEKYEHFSELSKDPKSDFMKRTHIGKTGGRKDKDDVGNETLLSKLLREEEELDVLDVLDGIKPTLNQSS